ncbi:TIGR02281 family clan AA aspartic protease [Paracoccus sanguinis]|uniref:retropepsin-like aspartic protease family protein n=1 Tax=Paracoccus sanguinis TaxID=1545044 RepID=UPI00051FD63B|nr:TIGR02281 family clan AA aspartic protease [Paracoccus sanguinis]KGJ15406.1 aspartyl protease [Paracoccus sanguinis]
MSPDLARFAYLALLLVAVGGFLFVEFRRDAGSTSRGILAWGLIFVGLIAAAGLWDDISRDVMPRQEVLDGGRIEVPLGSDGHFHLTAEINGAPVRFVVDTGASSLALSLRDAGRAGIDADRLAFAGQAQTANGIVPTATVRLESVRIGEIEDHGVTAMVIGGEIDRSLMGMDYLRRFARVGFEGGRLVLER